MRVFIVIWKERYFPAIFRIVMLVSLLSLDIDAYFFFYDAYCCTFVVILSLFVCCVRVFSTWWLMQQPSYVRSAAQLPRKFVYQLHVPTYTEWLHNLEGFGNRDKPRRRHLDGRKNGKRKLNSISRMQPWVITNVNSLVTGERTFLS